MALSIFQQWVSRVYRFERPVQAGLLCASIALFGPAACGDAFGPRERPTGLGPDDPAIPNSSLLWYELQPRVITVGETDTVRVTVAVEGTPLGVQLQLPSGLQPLIRQQNGTYARNVAVNDLLFGYRTGDLHNAWVLIDIATSPTTSEQSLMVVNVKDATVSNVNTQTLVAGLVQSTSHVVNLRVDSLFSGAQVPAQILRTFYQHFPDVYDFINVVQQVQHRLPIAYFAVRNEVTGLGLQEFDRSDPYGDVQQLQGTLMFPNEAFFDPAETSVLHELGHRWMNFGNIDSVHESDRHWPISTVAHGVVGIASPTTGEPLPFRYQLTRQANGTYSVAVEATRPLRFNDFELYLMGLLPPDSVAPHIVFLNQQQYDQLRPGGVLSGNTDTLTVAEWIARDGPRAPSGEAAQRRFRMATIVVSRGRLLTREEMSYFNHMAARGEVQSDVPSPVLVGTVRTTTLPFFGATGGRAQLVTRLN